MSAFKRNIIYINVTKGDCINDNRTSGSSNTGTYYVSSSNDFGQFVEFFKKSNTFKFSIKNIEIYRVLVNEFFSSSKEQYIGKMKNFDSICSFFSSLKTDPEVKVGLRLNDNRCFMQFKDNNETFTQAFRSLLYENMSIIAIEEVNNIFYIYPVINEKYLHLNNMPRAKANSGNGFVFEEE